MASDGFTRVTVYAFLAAVLACGFFSVEAWPLTGWKLFSQVRSSQQTGWLATATTADGREAPIDFASLGRGYTGALHVMGELPRRSRSERTAICGVWLDAVRQQPERPVAVHIYRTRSTVPRTDAPAPPAKRTLYLECSA